MMAKCNMKNILAKTKQFVKQEATQSEIRGKIDKTMLSNAQVAKGNTAPLPTPEEAADKFISVLRKAMESAGLSDHAIAAIDSLDHTPPVKLSGDNHYLIRVYFSEDLSRPSLYEEKYGRITDLAALLNNGVDHQMQAVYGQWHGARIRSRTVIPGTHFMEQAVRDFLANYGTDYHVTDITIEESK